MLVSWVLVNYLSLQREDEYLFYTHIQSDILTLLYFSKWYTDAQSQYFHFLITVNVYSLDYFKVIFPYITIFVFSHMYTPKFEVELLCWNSIQCHNPDGFMLGIHMEVKIGQCIHSEICLYWIP